MNLNAKASPVTRHTFKTLNVRAGTPSGMVRGRKRDVPLTAFVIHLLKQKAREEVTDASIATAAGIAKSMVAQIRSGKSGVSSGSIDGLALALGFGKAMKLRVAAEEWWEAGGEQSEEAEMVRSNTVSASQLYVVPSGISEAVLRIARFDGWPPGLESMVVGHFALKGMSNASDDLIRKLGNQFRGYSDAQEHGPPALPPKAKTRVIPPAPESGPSAFDRVVAGRATAKKKPARR